MRLIEPDTDEHPDANQKLSWITRTILTGMFGSYMFVAAGIFALLT